MEHILACPKCGGANGSGQVICRSCGQSLTHVCPRCHVDIDPATGKCQYCGQGIDTWPVGHPDCDEKTPGDTNPVSVQSKRNYIFVG